MMQGLIIGLVGTTVGASAGWALSTVLTRYKLIQVPADVYQMSYMPFRVLPLDFALVVAARDPDLLHRDDLPVAAGGEARSRPGAAIRVTRNFRALEL